MCLLSSNSEFRFYLSFEVWLFGSQTTVFGNPILRSVDRMFRHKQIMIPVRYIYSRENTQEAADLNMLFLVFLCCSLSLLFREFVFLKKLNWSEKYLRFVVRGQTHNNGRRGVCSQWPSTLYAHKILRQHCYILPISRRNKSKTRNREAISAGVSIPAEIILRWGNKLCFLFMFMQLVFCCGFVLKDNIYIYIYIKFP